MSEEEPPSPTEWLIAESSSETPHHPKRRKNRQRRNKARRQRQQAELAASQSPESEEVQKTQVEERKFPRDVDITWLESEIEEGNIEYKLKIKDPNSVRFQQLVTQMKFRLSEGNGECYYCLGVADDGYPRGLPALELEESIEGVFKMAEMLHAKADIKWRFQGGFGQECAVIKITRSLKDQLDIIDLRLGVIGAMDVGKSTIIACLTTGQDGECCLDNGHGSARTNVLKHKHEIETGHTSTVSKHLLGYDEGGQILNYCGLAAMTPAEIGLASTRLVNLIDMGGHERYLKTVFKGLTSMCPDYALLCISALTGVTPITRQHLTVALALEIPIIFVITKIDLAQRGAIESIHNEIRALGKLITNTSVKPPLPTTTLESDCARLITTMEEAKSVAEELFYMKTQTQGDTRSLHFIAPIISISTVSGEGLRLLLCLLNALKNSQYLIDAEVLFQVDQVFKVGGVGTVLSGLLVSGLMTVGQSLKLGPNEDGNFKLVQIQSLHCSQVPIKMIKAGQTATISAMELSLCPSDEDDLMDSTQDLNCNQKDEQFRSIKEVKRSLIKIKAQYGRTSSQQLEVELQGHVLVGLDKTVNTVTTFEAVVVLLGGQWPARGLLSGRWPPTQFPDSESDGQSGSSCGNPGTVLTRRSLSPSPSRVHKTGNGCYRVIVYSRSTRQAALIVSMEELPSTRVEDGLLSASIQAAAAVGSVVDEEDEEEVEYCVARVVFLLQRNPEWLEKGEVLIVRDQTHGYLSGIGVITQL